jgi:hypothetical protein
MATTSSIGTEISGFQVNTTPADFNAERDLSEGFLEFFQPLHQKFTHRRDELVADRAIVLADSHGGNKPVHRYPGHAVRNGWEIQLPEWCEDQRNQMTGPADDAELVVKMLNSGAPGVMLDLEDSTVNESCCRYSAQLNSNLDPPTRIAYSAGGNFRRAHLGFPVRCGANRFSGGTERVEAPAVFLYSEVGVGGGSAVVARRVSGNRRGARMAAQLHQVHGTG